MPARSLFLFLLVFAIVSPSVAQVMEDHLLYTKTYSIGRQHWLWLERVAREDPDYQPAHSPDNPRPFEIYGKLSPLQLYAKAGIELGEGEAINAGVRAPQIIIRATGANHQKICALMQTIRDWESGRTDAWHHSAVRARNAEAE